jgi:hypothetical protein
MPPAPLKPLVTNPRQQQEQELQAKLMQHPQGFWQNLRHIAGTAARVAGDIVAPGETELVTRSLGQAGIGPDANIIRQRQLAGLQQGDIAQQDAASKRNLEGQQGAYYGAHAREVDLTPLSPEEAESFGNPALAGIPMNAQQREQLAKQAGINTTRVDTNAATNTTRKDIATQNSLTREELAKLKPEQRDDRAIRLNEKLQMGQPLTQEEQAYLGAYGKYIQQTKVEPGVARAQAFGMFRPVQVLGSNGDVQYEFSGNAIKNGSATPQSMNFRTAVGMSKFMTSGNGGQTIQAYNTANDHLELLGKAMEALENGDVQAVNKMSNSFKQEFGSAAPTNVNAVKAMLAGELANVAKVTGATDPEIQEQKDNLNRANSPEQIRGFITTNHELMDQKAFELYQQYQQGEQGAPAFGTSLTGRGPTGGGSQAKGGGTGAATHKWNAETGQIEEIKK